MNPKKNNTQTRIILDPDILIHDRPDYRGLEHESVEEYLARVGKVKKIEGGESAEPIFRRVRQNFKFQNGRRG